MADQRFDIERLVRQEIVATVPPWDTGDEAAVDRFLRDAVEAIEQRLRVASRAEFDHYGSGYASYVDAWFFRQHPEFRIGKGDEYSGLVVLLSRLTNHFVLGEGVKSWNESPVTSHATAAYLPSFEQVDRFENEAVLDLVPDVRDVLTDLGMIRLERENLSTFLPEGTSVPTILTDAPYRLFDAIFHWED